uniref:Serine/arginine repetitive matrix protein 1-like n=1 Tax=Drosophila rhopaloa TaxID=1041015 RepID=A0A6P4ECR2_DRORH
MSTRITRAPARRQAALQRGPEGPVAEQGRSEARPLPIFRPTQTPRRGPEDDGARSEPEPIVTSDESDMEWAENPVKERREWRLKRARDPKVEAIPPGYTRTFKGAAKRPRGSGSTSLEMAEARAKMLRDEVERRRTTRAPYEERIAVEKDLETAQREWERMKQAAAEAIDWHEPPPTPRPQEWPEDDDRDPAPSPPPRQQEAEAPRPPKWAPARPPTPEAENPHPPKWTPARPPTPRHGQEVREEEPEEHIKEEGPRPGGGEEQWQYCRTEIPQAHVAHALNAFVAGGVQWRQHTVTWTWPVSDEAKATVRREDAGWLPPTPETGDVLEKGPWVWPTPTDNPRPKLQRQISAPEARGPVARPTLVRMASRTEGGSWQDIAEEEWPAGLLEQPVIKHAMRRGGRRCVMAEVGYRKYRIRLAASGQ